MMDWRRPRVLATAVLLVLTLTAIPATGVAAAPSRAAVTNQTITMFTFNRVPVINVLEVGTVTAHLSGTPGSFSIDWSYRGLTNGMPGAASGGGTGQSGNPSNLTLNLTSIDSWNVPGFPEPQLPKTGSGRAFTPMFWILTVSDPNVGTIVSGVPVTVFPGFTGPFSRPGQFFFESSLGSGSETFTSLPGSRRVGPASFPALRGRA